MRSNVARGAYFKSRTRKWLAQQGYEVADLEIVRWIFRPGGRFPQKADQFGSDLLAVSGSRVLFVQVKGGEQARGGTFPDARREFAKFQFPRWVSLLIVAWPPRARHPRVVCGRTGDELL